MTQKPRKKDKKNKPLSDKRQAFIDEYCINGFNATQAYKKAYPNMLQDFIMCFISYIYAQSKDKDDEYNQGQSHHKIQGFKVKK